MAELLNGSRRWSPTNGTQADILELRQVSWTLDDLCSTLAAVAAHLTAYVTVLVGVRMSGGELSNAMIAVEAMNLPFRVCLVVDRHLLGAVAAPNPSFHRIGLLLDGVDARTSLADIAHEAIEAVRFEPGFARAADDNVRSQCVLEAAMGLVQNIGLCTFGPAAGDGASDVGRQFDYITTSRESADSALLPGREIRLSQLGL